jgi:hypothetical protein
MHHESRFSEWEFLPEGFDAYFHALLSSHDVRFLLLETTTVVGMIVLRACKRELIKCLEIFDEVYYVVPEERGNNVLDVVLEEAKKFSKEMQEKHQFPTALYVDVYAPTDGEKLVASWKKRGGNVCGYMIRIK